MVVGGGGKNTFVLILDPPDALHMVEAVERRHRAHRLHLWVTARAPQRTIERTAISDGEENTETR
eukprot:1899160-Pyramimonas_sp.AAC.1